MPQWLTLVILCRPEHEGLYCDKHCSVLLEAYDIPLRWGYVDGHGIYVAVAIPLPYLWWSFAKEDAEMRTSAILKKTR